MTITSFGENMVIKEVVSDHEITLCWEVMKLLRPHLVREEFLFKIKEMQSEGYRLVFIEKDNRAVSAIGFRYLQFLFNGKHIYIDDLSTLLECRGKGYGGILLEHVHSIAREEGYTTVTLDSGFGRHDAHRLYLNQGYKMSSLHFTLEL